MSRARRLDRLEQTRATREPVIARELSTRCLEATWTVLERRSFNASADVIDTVTSKLLARPDAKPEVKAQVQRYLAAQG